MVSSLSKRIPSESPLWIICRNDTKRISGLFGAIVHQFYDKFPFSPVTKASDFVASMEPDLVFFRG